MVLDTNILIDDPNILYTDQTFVLPFTVLQELDHLKRNAELSFAARSAIKGIYHLAKRQAISIVDVPDDCSTNDERIVMAAKRLGVPILTNDIGCRVIALAHQVEVIDNTIDEPVVLDYNGYTFIEGALDYESYASFKEMQHDEFKLTFDVEVLHNHYYIIQRIGGGYHVWKEIDGRVVRISTSQTPFTEAGIKIQPKDIIQSCAWDAAMSDIPLTILEGRVGSSKTLTALVGLLSRSIGKKSLQRYTKIYYTRAPIPVDKTLQLGFMPGTAEDKSKQWVLGITSNLKFLLGQEESEKQLSTLFEFVSLESIQGLSLQDNEAILCDEYQLLSRDMLKMLLTRAGEGTKVILAGDPDGQTYGINRSQEGFKVLHQVLGKTKFISYLKLNNVYRSELSAYIDDLFEGKTCHS